MDVCKGDELGNVFDEQKKAKEIYERAIELEDWGSLFDGTKRMEDMTNEEKQSDEALGPEEGIAAKGVTSPDLPSQKEIDEHCLTHIPYRHSCYHCVRAKAINDAHHETSDGRRAEEMTFNATTTYSIDYGYINEKLEPMIASDTMVGDETLPLPIGKDRTTGMITAHEIYQKGKGDGYPIYQMKSDIERACYLGGQMISRSDQEPAIIDLQRAVGKARGTGAEMVMTQSEVGESTSNAEVEGTIRRVFGQMRVIKGGLEGHIGRTIPRRHALFLWLVEWSANVLNRFVQDKFGKKGVCTCQM